MPKVTDNRFDFLGGLNASHSPDVLDAREVQYARNVRLTTYGALTKRAGTMRITSNGMSAASGFSSGFSTGFGTSTKVLGVQQWDNPSATGEIVAICDGDLWYKTLSGTTWTNVSSTLSGTNQVSFAPYKTGGTNRLYFAEGSLRKWTATTLTTSITGSPSGARFIAVYGERMFCAANTMVLYWSKINDPETWSAPDGGQANVETYDSEPITGLATVGSSLLIFKKNSIARFTGTTTATIEVRKETEGVSPDVGCIAPMSIVRVDDYVFFLSDRGPYIANESGVQAIGQKIEREMEDWNKAYWDKSVAVYNALRREIWLFVPDTTSITNNVGYCYNTRAQQWTGPWEFGGEFDVQSACRFEDANSVEGVLLGGYDGWVRDGDYGDDEGGARDDQAVGGTGGHNVEMEVKFPPLLFGDPGAVKILHGTQYIHADLQADGNLTLAMRGDERTTTSTTTIATKGPGVKAYRFHGAWRGRRPELTITDSSDDAIVITGLQTEGNVGRRVV